MSRRSAHSADGNSVPAPTARARAPYTTTGLFSALKRLMKPLSRALINRVVDRPKFPRFSRHVVFLGRSQPSDRPAFPAHCLPVLPLWRGAPSGPLLLHDVRTRRHNPEAFPRKSAMTVPPRVEVSACVESHPRSPGCMDRAWKWPFCLRFRAIDRDCRAIRRWRSVR